MSYLVYNHYVLCRGKNKGGVSKQQYKKNQKREEERQWQGDKKQTKRERKREKNKFNVSKYELIEIESEA